MVEDLRRAFALLTILPVGHLPISSSRKQGYACAYYPLVGLVIGGLIAGGAALRLGSPDLRALVVLVGWVALTGGLHLDGLADACDGLLATVMPARRLEIMKDPRVGTWAVIGLVVLLLGKWVALRSLSSPALLLVPVAGRWAMTLVLVLFPSVRAGGIGAYFRDGAGYPQILIATLITGLVAAPFGLSGALTLGLALAVALLGGRWAARRLGGGLTGDVYGALCELVELLCLIGLGMIA